VCAKAARPRRALGPGDSSNEVPAASEARWPDEPTVSPTVTPVLSNTAVVPRSTKSERQCRKIASIFRLTGSTAERHHRWEIRIFFGG
jgi:hypothetical protein